MKLFFFLVLFLSLNVVFAKEWKNLTVYKKETKLETLPRGDWFTKDRKQNSIVWQQANRFNLLYMYPNQYTSVEQRLGFYIWLQHELDKKGNEIYWVKMASFVSEKLNVINIFPYKYVVKKTTIQNTNYGSEVVFNNSFYYLKDLFLAAKPLKNTTAEIWDLKMLYREQYEWVETVYQNIDTESLNQISQIAKGKGVYRFFVPKGLTFIGNLKNPDDRYYYAVNVLLPYCKWSN
ncbi:Insecticidal toxin complex protein [uncultured Formosa sp.]|uniref:Insecticidal toxin complex protein n=1 Tax=uncultured Formosa sp. TaxID=255435 RepID=UPI00261F5D01|nr:Insecticidal toxin complex protein [uncultured Formosa sp.]